MIDYSALYQRLGYDFLNQDLCYTALCHCSFYAEQEECLESNERLEWLGDSILGAIVTDIVLRHCPTLDEGKCSQIRAALIDTQACYQYALHIGLHDFILLGKGEAANTEGVLSRTADLFEAIVGAIYLDRGFEAAYEFVKKQCEELFIQSIEHFQQNPKMRVQELLQKNHKIPSYRVLDEQTREGKSYFIIGLYCDEELLSQGEGGSKKAAEINAAYAMLHALEQGESSYLEDPLSIKQ